MQLLVVPKCSPLLFIFEFDFSVELKSFIPVFSCVTVRNFDISSSENGSTENFINLKAIFILFSSISVLS